MAGNDAEPHQDRIVLRGDLSEISHIYAWVGALSRQYDIAEDTTYAINLCLEEAVSNTIRHGYSKQPGNAIVVTFSFSSHGNLVFTIEDDAPPFNPLETSLQPFLDEQGEIRIGGQGIRLIRGFADTLEYEHIPAGNRLRMGFLARVQ